MYQLLAICHNIINHILGSSFTNTIVQIDLFYNIYHYNLSI